MEKGEFLIWAKYKFWEKGIPPREFKKTSMSDIYDVLDIDIEVANKQMRETKIQEQMMRMKYG